MVMAMAMAVQVSSPVSFKRRRLISAPKRDVGREIADVCEKPEYDDGADEFYDLTAEDYFQILSTKKGGAFVKAQREAEEAERRSRMTKAVIRVRFPDNRTLEATFQPSDKIQSLVDHLKKVVDRPEWPFHLFTTPPKQVLKDMSRDFYSTGFVPGAVVHLCYGAPN